MIYLFIILLCTTLSAFLCGKARDQLLAAAVMDNPNERSMHNVPIPRGGGIGIWLTVFPVWVIYDIIKGQLPQHALLMIATAALIFISWLDDKNSLPARKRFAVHILAVALGVIAIPIDHMVFQGLLPLWLDRIIAGFAWLWFINLTNFMDGIDGLSGAQTVHTTIGFMLMAALVTIIAEHNIIIAACLCGAALGFLVWNWHPARLFLGDVGSIPIGFLLGYLMIEMASEGFLGIALTLPLYYVADASMTLIRRMIEKKKFWQAHREHFYQKAALAAGSPKPVVKAVIITNTGLLVVCVVAFALNAWALVLGPLLVAGLLWYLKRLSLSEQKALNN